MKKRGLLAVLVLAVGLLALTAAGCGGDDDGDAGGNGGQTEAGGDGDVQSLPASSCTALEYGGEGDPDALIVSDLPMQGSSRTQTVQMVKAIRFILNERGWKAGDLNIAYQVCDDATAQAGKWDSGKCSQNGQAYAGNSSVIGIIGTFNSGCAQIIIPIANQAPGGGLAMVSPANTLVCLTEGGPGCDGTEPDKYYPSGTRNYVRVVAHDIYQGAAVAEFAQSQGVTSMFILNDKESYGLGVAERLRNALSAVDIEVAGFAAWEPRAASYEAIMRQIGQSGADGIFLGGLIDENGGQVIKDKVAVLGPNDGDVKLFAPDGFTTQATIDEAGVENARGGFFSVAGVPTSELTGEGAEFIQAFQQELGDEPADPYSAYAAQAAVVLLDAIERAGEADRAAIIGELENTRVEEGILGTFQFNENGDPAQAGGAVVGFTIYRAEEELTPEEVISPKQETIDAARGS